MSTDSKVKIEVGDLRFGMFVVELDRPWLDSPFALQGFLLNSQEQLDALQRLCKYVYIDRYQSTGKYHQEIEVTPTLDKRKAGHGVTALFGDLVGGMGRLFSLKKLGAAIDVLQEKEQAPSGEAAAEEALADAHPVEEEIVTVAPTYEDAQGFVRELFHAIRSSKKLDLKRASAAIDAMTESILRNPDALIWLARLKRTDNAIYDHALNVSVHMMVLGQFIGLPKEQLNELGMIGLLQDVGKTRVPVELLHKRTELLPDEFEVMKKHVMHSIRILSEEGSVSASVIDAIAQHHERYDGSGYPLGLKGKAIHLKAQMAGLIDCYCDMIDDNAMSNQTALERIYAMRDKEFRASLVEQLIQSIGLYPVGTLVELNSGEVGVVIQQNRVRRLKPKVMVLLNPDKSRNSAPATIHLINNPVAPDGSEYRIACALPPGAYGIDTTALFG